MTVTCGSWTMLGTAVRVGRSLSVLCQCSCGHRAPVDLYSLRNGKSTRCKRCMGKASRKIEDVDLKGRLYRKWKHMMDRCYQTGHQEYPRYGGRGITVADSLKDFSGFLAYCLSLNGHGDKSKSLDRCDNDKGYEPGNLRFASAREQTRNRRTGLYLLDANGAQIHYRDAVDKIMGDFSPGLYSRAKYFIARNAVTTVEQLSKWASRA